MKHLILLCILLFSISTTFSQNLQKFVDDFKTIIFNTPTQIQNQNWCNQAIDDLDDISDDLEEVLDNPESIHPDDVKVLRAVKKGAEALESFLQCVGSSSYMNGYLKPTELATVQSFLDVDMTEVFAGKFCCRVYMVRFGKFISLLAFKSGGKEIYEIKSKIKSGTSQSSMTMGLSVNEYRKLWSNEDNLAMQSYHILSIECKVTGSSMF